MRGVVALLVVLAAVRSGSAALPDLVAEAFEVRIESNASVNAGDVVEGCAGGGTGRTLLRFGMRTRNVGGDDLVLGSPGCPDCRANPGAPCANPLYVCSTAHGHAHFNGYARAELVDAADGVVAAGRKIGFCVFDLECGAPQYTCSYQGLSAGCADIYSADLPCQYIDLTGVTLAPGEYRLRVTVDPDGILAEADEGNNAFELPLSLDCDTAGAALPACTPNPYLCYRTDVDAHRPAPPGTFHLIGAHGPFDVRLGAPHALCAPASAGTETMTDPATFLRVRRARPASRRTRPAPRRDVRVTNQLGEARIDVLTPDAYDVPAAVSATGEPAAPLSSRHDVDRFACFAARPARGAGTRRRPTTLTVADALFKPERSIALSAPRRLCSPVTPDAVPMKDPARHLLCYGVVKAPRTRLRDLGVHDELVAARATAVRARELCLPTQVDPPRPLLENLRPCAATVDVWTFPAAAGRTLEVRVDTTDAATAADLCAEATCGDVHLDGDDEVACTFKPPAFACPVLSGVATTDGTCTLTVHTCGGGCADSADAGYVLRVAVGGEDGAPTLVVDDGLLGSAGGAFVARP